MSLVGHNVAVGNNQDTDAVSGTSYFKVAADLCMRELDFLILICFSNVVVKSVTFVEYMHLDCVQTECDTQTIHADYTCGKPMTWTAFAQNLALAYHCSYGTYTESCSATIAYLPAE